MTLRLIFVRHGLSSFNKEGRIQGRNDLSTLTREGQLQAEAAGKTISSIPIDAIYSSPLQRASETTKIIIKQHQSELQACLLYTSPSPRDRTRSRMPSSA